jgi:hypothetical protein
MYKLSDITWVSLETTNICNMTCDYCPKSLDKLNHRKTGVSILSRDNFLKIIDYLPNLPNLKYVSLTDFNEFFQTPELTAFYLPELKKRGLPYAIFSNGSVVPKNIRYYIEHPPVNLVIGLQTITESQYYLNNRLDKVTWNEYLNRVSDLIKFFYDNCQETLISIEIAINNTNNLFHRVTNSIENKHVPSRKKQEPNVSQFVKSLSALTGIEFNIGGGIGRMDSQEVIAKTSNDRIVFGFKVFSDISSFYDNIPVDHSPVCSSDSITFDTNGKVKMCCIDYMNSTEFADVSKEEMSTVFIKYLSLVDEMRSDGSRFDGCKNCMGYKNKREKFFSIRKNYYPKVAKKFPIVRTIRDSFRR